MGAESVQTVAVLGSGQMGAGIAQVCAAAALKVRLYDSSAAALARATESIAANLERQVQKQKISAVQAAEARAAIAAQESLGDWLQQADVVIEAVSESLPLKQQLYADIAPCLAGSAVLASNTSSYAIATLAESAPAPARFIGMHFMNPVPLMPLVEIIRGRHTADSTAQCIEALAQRLGKQTVRAGDSPGFITNRLLLPMLNEAAFALHENLGGVEDIDRAMTLGMRHPMGPLALADFIGLDTCLAILNVLHEGFRDDKYRACPLFAQLVADGCLGRKSGSGFYDYSEQPPRPAARFAAAR